MGAKLKSFNWRFELVIEIILEKNANTDLIIVNMLLITGYVLQSVMFWYLYPDENTRSIYILYLGVLVLIASILTVLASVKQSIKPKIY